MESKSFQNEFPLGGAVSDKFKVARAGQKSSLQKPGFPYTLSVVGQLSLNLWRVWKLLLSDPGITITILLTNFFESIVIFSIFYNLFPGSSSMDKRSLLEVLTLYEKRKIVEKHRRYALYHPSVETMASMIMDLPYKFVNSVCVNVTLYFMTNLHREPGPFFVLFFIRDHGHRCDVFNVSIARVRYQDFVVGAGTRRSHIIRSPGENLSLNEFVGRRFTCDVFVPNGPSYGGRGSFSTSRVCSARGSAPGEFSIEGAEHLRVIYGFIDGHIWRNLGIVLAFTILYTLGQLVATEFIMSEQSKGEILIFPRDVLKKKEARPAAAADEETAPEGTASHVINGSSPRIQKVDGIAKQKSTFHWKNICYELDIKGVSRTILDHRKTGYATQQDLHLGTATVRETLEFSALLRQPDKYSKQEKFDYVNEVIELVDLQDCANAVIGVLGEGLNVQQRKRLTIGIELAARPELLLFLDEPTSGLDSQTSWAICNLMEKLTNNGQAILCTIHQPSAYLFQRFDRLLLLARGGRTVYFGEVGRNSAVLIDYLERNGAAPFKDGLNPAEYMLDVIGATARSISKDVQDWPTIWRNSPEYQQAQAELVRGIGAAAGEGNPDGSAVAEKTPEFAAGLGTQILLVTRRVLQQYWRTPEYIVSKAVMTAGCAPFIGLTQVNAEMTERGLYNQMLFVYLLLVIFGQIIEQSTPMFITQRTLYEARERHAKTYSWLAFLCGTMTAEILWNSLMAVFSFLFFYYPLDLCHNAEHTGAAHSRGIAIAGIDTAEVSGGIVNLFFIMMFAFAGVLAGPNDLPGFWIFMYRVNPFTYIVEAFVATSLADAPVKCIDTELLAFEPPSGESCTAYLGPYIRQKGGYLAGEGNGSCSYCPTAESNSFLTAHGLHFEDCWRDFVLVWAYCVFNILGAIAMYWLLRVPKGKKVKL
ncbi:hypothetical protein PpBr36_02250 [Pyricularia pennisetigena]|uniref:hypothetical protein n=1 Tax=Pyricularia pennisetigena TaxID=1578925 RepID=UPI00114EEF45|nr:hypothetical protein PpBr36_02250 [Pyricularia pennisetigena]TLS30947.1 hypothetical protein PpBr36_02250 [Pyricularia pennisetigena]